MIIAIKMIVNNKLKIKIIWNNKIKINLTLNSNIIRSLIDYNNKKILNWEINRYINEALSYHRY
jgi:hypothetical protein